MKYTIFPEQARRIATDVNCRESYYKPTLDAVYRIIRTAAEHGKYNVTISCEYSNSAYYAFPEVFQAWEHTESQVDGCGEYIEEQLSQIGYGAEYDSVNVTLTIHW